MQIEDGIILHIIIYITQNPDPLISDCYYSMKGADVIDFFVYPIEEAWDQAPPWRKEAEKRGQIGKTLPSASPCPDYLSRQFLFSFLPQCRACFQAAMKATVEASRERTPSGRRIPSGREKGVCNWSWSF